MHTIRKHVLRFALPLLFLIVCPGLPARAAEAEELRLSPDLIAVFDNYGAIESITSRSALLSGKGSLGGRKKNQSFGMYQGWGSVLGNKVKCESGSGEVAVEGVLVHKGDPNTPEVEFKLRYKKESDGVLSVRMETIASTDGEWTEVPFFSLLLPVSQYGDATIVTEESKGLEKTYTVGPTALDIRSYGSRRVTITKGKQKLVIIPADDSQLSVLDGRSWKGDYLRVDLSPRREWKAAYSLRAGMKDVCEATFSFKNEE